MIASQVVNGTKRCGRCKEFKPVADFRIDRRTPSGLTSYCKPCKHLADSKRYGRGLHRDSYLKSRYGITQADYDRIWEEQGQGCAICGATEVGIINNPRTKGKFHLHIDHDHETGKIRGILCAPCNHGLGRYRDNPDLLQRAADYLRKHKGLAHG